MGTPLSSVDLILASTSRYRAELLRRIATTFRQISPEVDETSLGRDSPRTLAQRLAAAKASAVAERYPGAVVIGSDQVAACGDQVLGKPGSLERAHEQLSVCSRREATFYTAVCVADARNGLRLHQALDITCVTFRELDGATINRYVEQERPLDCAGSFKAEGLGITLFERIRSDDPTGLIGLPLIATCRLLRAAGIALP